MPFNVLSWALGFALSRTVGRILDKAGAQSFANDLRKTVLAWASKLPSEFRDLHPDALAGRLFESDSEELGLNRTKLQKSFEEGNIPSEQDWFDAIEERRQEVHAHLGEGAQKFFKADFASAEPHIKKLATILHQQCIKNEDLFKVSLYEMVRELLERKEKRRPERRPRPPDGLGVLSNVPELPQKFVARPEYLEPLKQKLLGKSEKTVAVTAAGRRKVGVQGMGGIGKTVLAAAVVREKEVRKTYPDGIIWLTLGQQPTLVARQVQLAKVLGDQQAAFQDVQQGKARLEELLADLACLVVLDDVWNAHHAAAFDVPVKKGRVLITTRFRNIVASLGAQEQRLDVLEEDQAFALLAQWAGTTVDELPILSAHEVVMECGGLPLALAMIGAMIQRRPEQWEGAVERLRSADIDKIKHDFPDYPYPDLLRAIGVSIDGLDEEKERYLDFATFPEDTPIPQAVLQTLWQTDGLDKHDVQDLLVLLENRSMLRRDEKGRITLHDLQFDYVRKQARETLAARHGKLLDAYQAQCEDGWHTVPDDGYFYQHLAYHFCQAGRHDELKKLLFDYRWLERKVGVTDPNELVVDYESFSDDSELPLVQGAIRLSTSALVQDRSHLASQLLGRLLSQKGKKIQSLLDQARNCQSGPWLRPLAATLTPPGGPLVHALTGHTSGVQAVAVTRDGRYAVSGSSDKTLMVWDLTTGKKLRQLTGHADEVNAVAVTPDGRYAVSGSGDKTLMVWDLTTGKKLGQLAGHAGPVQAVAVTPDGRYAVSGSNDKTLKLWDLTTGKKLRELKGPAGWVTAVAVTPDGRYAVSGSDDGTFRVWDLRVGRQLRCRERHSGPLYAVAVTPDGRLALSGSRDCTLVVWDLKTGKKLRVLKGHAAAVRAVAVTSDGRFALSGSEDKTVRVWELETGRELRSLRGHAKPVNAVAVTPDRRYVVSGSDDNTLKVWDLKTGKEMCGLARHKRAVTALAMTPDGRYAVSGSEDTTLKVWDLQAGKEVRQLAGHAGRVMAVAADPDGHYVVSSSDDKTVMLWDLETGEKIKERDTSQLIPEAMTGDGRLAVYTSSDFTPTLLDLWTGQCLGSLKCDRRLVTELAVTPDGRFAVFGSSDKTLKVLDLQSGSVLHTLTGHAGAVYALAVTPDGRYTVSGSDDHTLIVWDLKTGKKLRELKGHAAPVNAVATSPNARFAVSGSDDSTLKVWDVAIDEVTATFHGDSSILCCAVATDSVTIAAGEASGSVHFLRLENVRPGKSTDSR